MVKIKGIPNYSAMKKSAYTCSRGPSGVHCSMPFSCSALQQALLECTAACPLWRDDEGQMEVSRQDPK